jgi:ActR/RegA family two-component response regulator
MNAKAISRQAVCMDSRSFPNQPSSCGAEELHIATPHCVLRLLAGTLGSGALMVNGNIDTGTVVAQSPQRRGVASSRGCPSSWIAWSAMPRKKGLLPDYFMTQMQSDTTMIDPGGNKRTVFLLHDHPVVREGLARLIELQPDLSICGVEEDSTEALAEVAGLRPDITIIDSILLNESATSLISDLTRVAPSMKVVVLSVFDDEEEAKQAIRAGARGYVNKATQIVAAIRRVLGGEQFPGGEFSDALLALP